MMQGGISSIFIGMNLYKKHKSAPKKAFYTKKGCFYTQNQQSLDFAENAIDIRRHTFYIELNKSERPKQRGTARAAHLKETGTPAGSEQLITGT